MTRKTTRTTRSHNLSIATDGPANATPAPLRPRYACLSAPARLTGFLSAVIALGAASAPAGARAEPTGHLRPLPAPAYQALAACPAPISGHAGCLALELAPRAISSAAAALSPRELARAQRARRHHGPSASLGQIETGSEATQEPRPVTPAYLHSAYGLPDQPLAGSPTQTIALVDAYNDPHAEADLGVYDRNFELPECTAANGCFEQVNQRGESGNLPFPATAAAMEAQEAVCAGRAAGEKEAACAEVEEAAGWTLEISTDIDVAHSLCQSCHIRLVEANSSAYSSLEKAEQTAARPLSEGGVGATEISNSWSGEEPATDSTAFDHHGIVTTAAAGDDGYLNWTEAREAEAKHEPYYAGADYPASSPHVVAVGGTKLTVSEAGARQSESVWNEDPGPDGQNHGAGGGGCSTHFTAKPWQQAVPDWTQVGCGSERSVADVAADGDPYTGVLVYDSSESKEYLLVIGGTSVASPIIASTFALAGGAQGVEYPAQTLYSHLGSVSLYDVIEGANGMCDGLYTAGCEGSMSPLSPLDCGQDVLICNAAPGYDGPTGVGTPEGIGAFEPGSEGIKQAEEKRAAEKQQAEERVAAERRAAEKKAAEERAEEAAQAIKSKEESALEERQAAERRAAELAAAEQRSGGSAGAGQGNKGASGGQSGGSALTGGTTGAGSLVSPPSPGATPPPARGATVDLTDLTLTLRAIEALDRSRPAISSVAFAFTLSASARVRVTLARPLHVRGRPRWAREPGSFTYAAPRGRDRLHLKGRLGLAPGRYRLTLAPAHGSARSLTFVLG